MDNKLRADFDAWAFANGFNIARERYNDEAYFSSNTEDAWTAVKWMAGRTSLVAGGAIGPQGCACRWDENDVRIATCERHQGWLDVVQEWSDRARNAEKTVRTLRHELTQAWSRVECRNPMCACPEGDEEARKRE